MVRRPPRTKRTDTLFPDTTPVRAAPSGGGEDLLDGFARGGDDDVGLGLRQAEWRREAEDVALRHGARDDPALQQGGGQLRAVLARRLDEPAPLPLLDHLAGAEHALRSPPAHPQALGQAAWRERGGPSG